MDLGVTLPTTSCVEGPSYDNLVQATWLCLSWRENDIVGQLNEVLARVTCYVPPNLVSNHDPTKAILYGSLRTLVLQRNALMAVSALQSLFDTCDNDYALTLALRRCS